MRVIDDRGRLLGRVNIVDAAVLILVLLLIPVGFGAYALFKDPRPSLTSVDQVPAMTERGVPVKLRGQHLRPLLRVMIGTIYAEPFLVESPTAAEVRLPDVLKPGTYDVALYDQGQQLTLLPGALTVLPPPFSTATVQVVGEFVVLDAASAGSLTVGATFPAGDPHPVAKIVTVKPAQPAMREIRVGETIVSTPQPGKVEVPAVIELSCRLSGNECLVGDTILSTEVAIPLPSASGLMPFRVKLVRSSAAKPEFPQETRR